MQEKARLHVLVHGRVQGVYFRDFTMRKAQALGLTGFVKNLSDGRTVEVMAEGERQSLTELLQAVKKGPEAARVDRVEEQWSDFLGERQTFEMRF